MRRLFVLGTIFVGLLVAFGVAGQDGFQTARRAEAVESTTTWMYPASGGIQIPGGGPTIDTQFIPTPACTNCYITKIVPDLVYMSDPDPANHPDGTTANYGNNSLDNIWLHHLVVVDACPGNARIFASGNERTTLTLPSGYGYFQGTCGWVLNYHIHNSSNATRGVAVKLVVTYSTGVTLKRITPVEWDVANNPGSSEYQIPTGYSDTETSASPPSGIASDWTSTIQGRILGMGGHIHDYGISVSAYNLRLGDYICTSVSGYGSGSRYLPTGGPGTPGHPAAANALTLDTNYKEANGTPDDRYHIQQMAPCSATPAQSIICKGDVIRLHTQYNNQSGFPIFDAMGIIGAYVDTSLPDANSNGTIDACDNSDTDVDTFSDSAESFLGTDPTKKCAATPVPNDESGPDAWPMDFNDDQKASLADVLKYSPVFNITGPGLPYQVRFDLNRDNHINLADVLKFAPFFNTQCTP